MLNGMRRYGEIELKEHLLQDIVGQVGILHKTGDPAPEWSLIASHQMRKGLLIPIWIDGISTASSSSDPSRGTKIRLNMLLLLSTSLSWVTGPKAPQLRAYSFHLTN
jgi:hypothetical protein